MRSIFALVFGVCLAAAIGLWTAWLTVRSPAPIDVIRIGEWQAWPNSGTIDVDPYSRARLARTGEIPLGSGEGVTLLAQDDNQGAPLTSRCDYTIAGQTPPARLWTLAIEDREGHVIVDQNELAVLSSDAILRTADGGFEISLSSNPKAGNWVPTDDAIRFRVVIRLYDTTVRTVTALTTLTMPDIMRDRCA